MRIAIMQPYVFPYLGYFQLINEADLFVFYDDVNFIKRGWVNRNRILLNKQEHLITIPCLQASQNKLINEVAVDFASPELKKVFKTIQQAYQKSPNYAAVIPWVESIFFKEQTISQFAISFVEETYNYLGVEKAFKISSRGNYNNQHLVKADRLIDICKKEGITNYVNAIGGMEIYTKEYFSSHGVDLQFLKPTISPYHQGMGEQFVPGLSILDVLMYESKDSVIEKISEGQLV